MKKTLQYLLIIYMLIQPFMEIIYFYQGELATVGPFTIPTLLRIALVGLMLILFLLIYKFSPETYKLVGYGAVVLLYLAAHIFLTRRALGGINDGFTYSLSQEISYVLRVLFPVLVLIISSKIEVSTKTVEKIVWWLGSVISAMIVLSNLFVIGVASYNKSQIIKGNIFTWFDITRRASFMDLATDGFFLFANTISAILILLFPIMLYYYFKKSTVPKFLMIILNIFAVLIIGTRTAIFGAILSVLVIGAGYIYTKVMHRDQFKFSRLTWTNFGLIILSLMLMGVVYPFSPSTGRVGANDQVELVTEAKLRENSKELKLLRKEIQKNPDQKQELSKNYIETHFNVKDIYGNVVSATNPVDRYPTLWVDVLEWPAADQVNFRKIEKAHVNLVASQVSTPIRLLVGTSYVRMNYFIFNYERDFFNQFYTLGILGLILFVLPFVIAGVYLGLKYLFDAKYRNFENFSYLVGFVLFFGAAFLTGNVLDSITAGSIVAFLIGQNLLKNKKVVAQTQ